MNPKMVGAQKAIKIASSLFPFRKRTSDTIIIDTTTRSMTQFTAPILSIKFLIIPDIILNKYSYLSNTILNNNQEDKMINRANPSQRLHLLDNDAFKALPR
ncbi:MAG: hypothetical protein HKP42_04665 [Maribacter sp.]|nr:hypothetical protein [Maribacter sp.]